MSASLSDMQPSAAKRPDVRGSPRDASPLRGVPPENFATNFATTAHQNPSHPITSHPKSLGAPDMSYPALGAGIGAVGVVAVGGIEPPTRGL